MTTTRNAALAALVAAAAACFLAACGPAVRGTVQPAPHPVVVAQPPPTPNLSGFYRGPNVLVFALTQPVEREMPPEEHVGSASIMDSGGPTVTIEARIFEDGDACRIEARRVGNRAIIIPGSRCASRLFYDGVPVAAMVQVDDGEAEFIGDVVRVVLRGPFVGEVLIRDRVMPVGGSALWRFEGRR